jgi:hypothetical protein
MAVKTDRREGATSKAGGSSGQGSSAGTKSIGGDDGGAATGVGGEETLTAVRVAIAWRYFAAKDGEVAVALLRWTMTTRVLSYERPE